MMNAHRQQRQRRDAPKWDVFLSYVRRDGWRVAERIEEGLEQRGLSVWRYDNRLSVGDDVSAGIEEALADSAYVVAVVSPMYARRPPRAVWTPAGAPGGPRMGILPVLYRTRPAYVAYRIPVLSDTLMRVWNPRDLDSLLDEIARIAGGGEEGPGGDPGRLDGPLLPRDESDMPEFKSRPGSRPDGAAKPGRMGEKFARDPRGFADTRGGDLLIGVGDGGRRARRGRSARAAKGTLGYTHPQSRRPDIGMSDADGGINAEAGPAASSGDIDVFLSYSHEVKDSVAEPLVRGLEKRGVSVWWDSTAMRISDTLDQKIREGIAGARHGVVIVSRDYLDSGWGQTELGGMFYRELRILPILYRVSAEDAQKSLPAIRGKFMRGWDDSPESIMDEIASVVKGGGRGPAVQGSGNAPADREAASRAHSARKEG